MNRMTVLLLALLTATTVAMKAQVVMNIDATQRGPVTSDYQYGLFFEEINHAGEGGLYAEMVRNRSFEEELTGWTAENGATPRLLMNGLMNGAQTLALDLYTIGASNTRMKGVRNEGFWGMNFVKDSTYTFSCWAKGAESYNGTVVVRLVGKTGSTVYGEATLQGTIEPGKWNKLTATIKATDSQSNGQLLLLTSNNGHLYVDMVSLFPYTWKGRKNGFRPELAQLLADTRPRFLRFPGGCYVEGQDTWNNAFQWKKTIGPVEERPGHRNQNWGYWSTDGIGFDEYLQLAEDMGAAPMYVVNVGLGHGYTIPMSKLDTLVQNTLDAIEYANGDVTTKWGALRARNGHPEPYNLKFIEIGNENYNFYINSNTDQSEQYPERYYKFYKAIKEKYPEIVTIGNVEAWGTDAPSWRNDYPVEMVDEHYYRSLAWMRQNYNKYDNYPRQPAVYVGEYAANSGSYGLYGNLNSALGEAIFMMGMEKNSDVVTMGSFAPIFMHEADPTWNYDMIHFNAASVFVTPSYHVQKLFGNNLGTQNLKWTETGNSLSAKATSQVGVATWDTQATYSNLKVTAADGTDLLEGNGGWNSDSGSWTISADGTMRQTANGQPCRTVSKKSFSTTGGYTVELRARKDGGAEGFLIIFDYQDSENYSWWNIGGWGNSQHAVEVSRNGSKTSAATAGGSVSNGRWYDLKIEVSEELVKCYMDGQLVHQYAPSSTERALYQSVQLDEKTGEIILKVANPNDQSRQLTVNFANMAIGGGTVQRLTSARGTDENTMASPDKVAPTTGQVTPDAADHTTLDIPAYSLSIYRFAATDVASAAEEPVYSAYEEEDRDKAAYLYAHMHSSNEYTCFALSRYGQSWKDMFESREVFDTRANTVTGGMRDAYVTRLDEGGFMLVGTDMTSALGWESNHIMDLMLSPDLVHWTKNVKIDLESEENLAVLGLTADKLTAAWAPQVIRDRETGHYVLYYSVGVKGDRHRIYYQLIDKDLNILTEPRVYFDPGYDVIDADIVWNDVDKQYVMLYKCESSNGFDRATATTLIPDSQTAGQTTSGTTVWTITQGFHIGENNQAIEGMSMWRLIGSTRWKLAYQNYSGGTYGYKMRDMDEHLLGFSETGIYMSGDVAPQHGCILKITQAEYDLLNNWEQVVALLDDVKAYNEQRPTERHAQAISHAEAALANSTTFEENAAAMAEALELLQGCETDLRDVLVQNVVEAGHGDLTPLIENANFAEGTKGWDANTSFTAANGYVAEFWNKNFDFWQTITGLPDGDYEVGVQSFYRMGSISNATRAHNNGTESLNAILYANDATVPVMSLYDESITRYTMSPNNYPNNVSDAQQAFNGFGLYGNTLRVSVTGGELTIGIRKSTLVSEDWCCFDNFTLTYLGTGSGIAITTAGQRDASRATFNLKGQRVDPEQSHGLLIRDGKKIVK